MFVVAEPIRADAAVGRAEEMLKGHRDSSAKIRVKGPMRSSGLLGAHINTQGSRLFVAPADVSGMLRHELIAKAHGIREHGPQARGDKHAPGLARGALRAKKTALGDL